VIDPGGDYNDGDNWRPSSEYGGSPGVPGVGPINEVVINEVLSHAEPPGVDAVELHDVAGSGVSIGGWFLSNSDENYFKYEIDSGQSIGAGGYIVFDEQQFNASGGAAPDDFTLDAAHGDDVWLMKVDGQGKVFFADHIEFGAAPAGESFGRWPDAVGRLYPMIGTTLDPPGENIGPRIGPVVISEIMYDPAGGGDEFIELFNPTTHSVRLYDPANPSHTWRFADGIEFTFPGGVEIPAGGVALVVPIDAETFRTDNAVPAAAQIFGPYLGALNNGGEQLRLMRPDEPPAAEPEFVPYVLVDEVDYDNSTPWPTPPSGDGSSLNRREPDLWGNDPNHWTAAAATPGLVDWEVGAATVVGRHVFYNNSRWDGFNPGPAVSDDAAIATDKSALLPGDSQATSANYTSYSRGINGLMIDVKGLADAGSLGAADFEFRVGNDYDSPTGWDEGPLPAHVDVRGIGADLARITLIWADDNPWTPAVEPGAIARQWLQVRLLAGEVTGLAQDDVFYIGNAIGETGNTTENAVVDAMDEIGARDNPAFFPPAAIENPYDFDRDKIVGATDQFIARSNRTFADALMLVSPMSVVATDDVSSVDSNGTVVIEVLANDRDAAGVLSGVYQVDALTQFGAAVTINGDNALAYDPSGSAALQALLPGETLDDTFKYSIRDASGRIDEGTVTVTVAGISVRGLIWRIARSMLPMVPHFRLSGQALTYVRWPTRRRKRWLMKTIRTRAP